MEKRYTVTQASEMLKVKSYVLRYWEEELELRIRRNEQGHRYYTDHDIRLFANIKELKNRGLQLRAIKELIPRISRTVPGSAESKIRLLPGETQIVEEPDPDERRMLEFQQILESHGITATVRRTLGSDIDASCGQLRRKYEKQEKGA